MTAGEISDPTVRTASALDWLTEAAQVRENAGLHRVLAPRAADDAALNLASNDYLGLSSDPRVVAGAVEATTRWGAGATASRLVVGTTGAHTALEADLADFLGTESALVFSSGYLANVGVISSLMGRGDLIVSDGGAHASLIDGCRLSRARVVVTDRGDHRAVAEILAARTEARAMVVTDSVYSIDGAVAPVAELHDAARARRGARGRRGARARRPRSRREGSGRRTRARRGRRSRGDRRAVEVARVAGRRGGRIDGRARSPRRPRTQLHLRHRSRTGGRRCRGRRTAGAAVRTDAARSGTCRGPTSRRPVRRARSRRRGRVGRHR